MISLWLPVAAWMVAIYVGAALPSVPGPAGAVPDTVLHSGGYAVLAVLVLRAVARGRWAGVTPRAMLLAFALATLHGVSVELEQMLVPTRTAEWRDVQSDMAGALGGLGLAWAWGIMKGASRAT